MALERHTGAVAVEALRSPVALGLAVAVGGIGFVAGLSLLAAAGVAVVVYGTGAAVVALLRRAPSAGRSTRRIDPFTLGEPWRQRVREAQRARSRYQKAVEGAGEGPLRDRLAGIGARIDAGVEECWRIANQGDALRRGLRSLEPGQIRTSLATAESDAGDGADAVARVGALRAQLTSAERLAAAAEDADQRLRLLSARLDEAAARAVELSLGAGSDVDLAGLGSEVDDVVDQLESLRLAIEEVEA